MIVYVELPILQLQKLFSIFDLGDIMYCRRTFAWFLQLTEAIFTKVLLQCESSNKYAP